MLMVPDEIFGSYILDSRPSSEFQYEVAKNKIVNLELMAGLGQQFVFTTPGDDLDGDGQNQGKLMRLASCIDLESRITARLFSHLDIILLTCC